MKYLRKSRAALKELREGKESGKHGSSVNNYAAVYPTYHKCWWNRVCYNNLNFEGHKWKGAVSFVSLIRNCEKVGRRVSILYLDWILNNSPWSSVFYTKVPNKAIDKGIICHTNVLSTLLMSGLSAVREIDECPNKVIIWGELVNAGLNPEYAYIATHYLEICEGGFLLNKPYYNTNHLSLNQPFTPKYLKNFCAGKIARVGEHSPPRNIFKKNTKFSGVFNLWGNPRDGKAIDFKYSTKPKKVKKEPNENDWHTNVKPNYVAYTTIRSKKIFVREFTSQMEKVCHD